MKKQLIGIVLICSGWLGSFAWAQGTVNEEIKVVGESEVVGQNFAKARQGAIADAMNEGIMKVSQEFFDPEPFGRVQDVIKLRLGKNKRRLVKDYRLLSEKRSEGKLQVELLVVPLRARVREELIHWGILFDRVRRPQFFIEIMKGERGLAWTQRVKSRFYDLGYHLTQVSQEADVVVRGGLESKGRRSHLISLELDMKQPAKKFRRKTFKVDAKLTELEGAGLVATNALARVLPAWIKFTGSGRVYEVEVSGLRTHLLLKELRKVFNEQARGFSEGRDAVYAPGLVVFQTVFDGEVGKLVKVLSGVRLAENRLKVVGVQDRKIRVELIKR